jgi:hypothetical protein
MNVVEIEESNGVLGMVYACLGDEDKEDMGKDWSCLYIHCGGESN